MGPTVQGAEIVSLNNRPFKDTLRTRWKCWSLEKQFCLVGSWVCDPPHMHMGALEGEAAFHSMKQLWWITLLIYLTSNTPSLYRWKGFGGSSIQLVQAYPSVFQHKIAGGSLALSVTVVIGAGKEIFVNLISLTSSKIKTNYLHHWGKEWKPARWSWFKK